jgi:hypothetical protein
MTAVMGTTEGPIDPADVVAGSGAPTAAVEPGAREIADDDATLLAASASASPGSRVHPRAPTVALPHPARRAGLAGARTRRASSSSPAAVGADDTTPVLQAMRALRVEGNPARARVLLSRYLDRSPRGTLAEEALAMSIEAATAHRDDDASAMARRYLRLYPAGHFSKLARQTLNGGAPPASN